MTAKKRRKASQPSSKGSILGIVLVEGIFVGMISGLLGELIAWPSGKLLSDTVGTAFIESPLTYAFATPARLARSRRCLLSLILPTI